MNTRIPTRIRPADAGPRGGSRERVDRELAAALQSERRRRPGEALAHYRDAIQLAQEDPTALAAALERISAACRRSPKDAALRHLVGAAYLFARDLRHAESHLRKAASLAPKAAPVQIALGDCLMQLGRPAEALATYRTAVALAPQSREARLRLAGLHLYRGEKAEARKLYGRLLEEDACDPLACAGLIDVSDYSAISADPPEYSAALSLAQNAELPPALRRMLCFSAAKIDRARNRLDLEFAHYVRAKAYFPHAFDLGYFSELVAALQEAIGPEFYSERAGHSDKSRRPVFVFGMPRSGTTLTEQILAAHPHIAAAGELTFFEEAARRMGISAQRSPASLPLERIAERIRALEPAEALALAASYREQLQWRGEGKSRVTDKMPGNFLHLWLIALVFRDGHFIHCIRDPLATCFSCFTTDLRDAHAYTRDFLTLAGYYRLYEDLMRHWRRVLPVQIFENSYETLVAEPESSARELLDAVQVAWDPACLSFHESDRLAQTASFAAVREPIHPRNLERWRAYEAYLGPLKEALDAGNLARS